MFGPSLLRGSLTDHSPSLAIPEPEQPTPHVGCPFIAPVEPSPIVSSHLLVSEVGHLPMPPAPAVSVQEMVPSQRCAIPCLVHSGFGTRARRTQIRRSHECGNTCPRCVERRGGIQPSSPEPSPLDREHRAHARCLRQPVCTLWSLYACEVSLLSDAGKGRTPAISRRANGTQRIHRSALRALGCIAMLGAILPHPNLLRLKATDHTPSPHILSITFACPLLYWAGQCSHNQRDKMGWPRVILGGDFDRAHSREKETYPKSDY